MRIIREGILPQEYVASPTCKNCKCHFEFTKGEGKTIQGRFNELDIQIACPTCKQYVYVSIDEFKPRAKETFPKSHTDFATRKDFS